MAEPQVPVRLARLSCRICARLLREPVTIPCGHSFCRRCISGSWAGVEAGFGCPECRRTFPSRPALIRNATLAEVVGDTARSWSGNESRRGGGGGGGGADPPPKRARSGAEPPGGTWCRRHASPLDVYRCSDEELVCARCASEEHTGHVIGVVGLERSKKQAELSKIQAELRQVLKEQEEKLENKERLFKQINEEARETEDHCESVIVCVTECLQKHYLSVRRLIRAQAEEAGARVPALGLKVEEMKAADAELERLARSENSARFLQEWPRVRSLCKDMLQFFTDPLPPFEVTRRAVEQLGRQLEELCDQLFASVYHAPDRDEQEEERSGASISQPHAAGQNGLSGTLSETDLASATREELLRYACELSLDPTTAHKDLTVSDGDKEVALRPEKPTPSPIRYPQRFVNRRQLLCREGLQGGTFYYEVELKGDKAEIALAYKGIDRKSSFKTSAFGANTNSWSLDRSSSYSVSHRDESVQLSAAPCHQRIGVYLNFGAGTLSFFEVQRNEVKFLYKVVAEFTEPLYPGFWLGEKCSIRICDLKP